MDPTSSTDRVPSLASSVDLLRLRRGLYGQLAPLIVRGGDEVALYTLIAPRWEIAGDELHRLEPKPILESLRSALNRRGLRDATGWFAASVHGEYHPYNDTYHPHLHAVVAGEKSLAFEKLRRSRTFSASMSVSRPVVRLPLTRPAVQLPYHTFQPFWPSVVVAGARASNKRRLRIPEPRHAEWLMWMHRCRFEDLVLLHGCAIRRGRVVLT